MENAMSEFQFETQKSDHNKFEAEACIAEYSAVHDEIRDRTNGVRRVTEYALIALGGITTLLSLSFQDIIASSLTTNRLPFPSYYLLLIIPALFVFLGSVYVDESFALYIGQAYVIHVLRPTILRIVAMNPNSNTGEIDSNQKVLHKYLWEWDKFHIFARGALTGSVTGFIRTLVTFLLPVGVPSAIYVVLSIRDKGHLVLWEITLLTIYFFTIAILLLSLLIMRQQIYDRLQKYKVESELITKPTQTCNK